MANRKINVNDIARRAGQGRLHRLGHSMMVFLCAPLSLVGATLIGQGAPAAASPGRACVAQAADVREALAVAVACGTEVEALSHRTEYTQVRVNPSGTATLVSAVTPQRVRRSDGSWADVDLSLRVAGSDGSLAPVATLANVRFSGGGPGPMVTWQENGSRFTLSWPGGPLPAPRVEGDTAVYESVLPGVDLHLTSTVDGFRYVLAVKTLAAAANPALRQVRYRVGGDVLVKPTVEGGLTVLDSSGRFFAASPGAVMWDSSVDPAAVGDLSPADISGFTAAPAKLPGELVSDAHRPGAASAVAQVGVAVVGRDLVVTPDADMLTDPNAALPIFIDPPFNKLATKWAYATSNNENNDTTNARVGLNPTTGARYRSYFQFDTSAMHDTTVLSAKIQMELDHSWSCGPTWVWLYQTSAFSVGSGGRIPWSGTGSLPLGSGATALDTWEGNAHEGGSCPQPNVTAVFQSTTLLEKVRYAVTQWHTYHVGLCACNDQGEYESSQDRWKRFETGKSYLIATYDLAPYKPVGQAFTTTADCYKQCSSPAVVRTTVPTLRIKVQAPFGGILLTAVEVRTDDTDTAPIVVDSGSFRVTTSTTPVTTAGASPAVVDDIQVPAGKLSSGGTYYWRATTRNENNLWSGWGTWQSFTVDTTAPSVSSVTSVEYPFQAWGAQVGTAGTFTFSGSPDVADYTWWVDSGASTTTTGTTANHTPSTDMVHTLHVRAKDVAGNASATFDYQFWVSTLVNRCWNWRLDETSGMTAADKGNTDPADTVCAPIGTSVTAMPGTLSSSGVAWVADAERNRVASFDGTGQIATSSAVLDTTKAFTVAAWVKFTDLAANDYQTVLSQAGVNVSRFQLQYRKDANGGAGGFCFTMRGSDAVGSPPVSACAAPVSWPVTQGQWVHLAGIYDPVANTIRVFVMGDRLTCGGDVAEATAPSSWSATGKFYIGRGTNGTSGTPAWWMTGSVGKVYAHQRALANTEICQMSQQ